jgi:hypothetical protein
MGKKCISEEQNSQLSSPVKWLWATLVHLAENSCFEFHGIILYDFIVGRIQMI